MTDETKTISKSDWVTDETTTGTSMSNIPVLTSPLVNKVDTSIIGNDADIKL